MKQIPLTGKNGVGKYAIVDDDLYSFLVRYKWNLHSDGYANTRMYIGNRYTTIMMHQFVLKPKKGRITDHRNRNRLDNRACNLRYVTDGQNNWNAKTKNTSGYKGVSWETRSKKWKAQIVTEGKRKHLGYFTDIIKAARAYNEAAKKYFGEYAYLNPV